MYNFAKQDTFNKCQRSFDISEPIDEEFVNLIKTTRDEFVDKEGLEMYSFVITSPVDIKLIHSCAIHEYEPDKLAWKTNTQVLAPMVVMCKPKANSDIRALAQIGRLQTKLGMLAIEHGYVTGYCLCFNSRAMASWNTTKRYVHVDPDTGRYIRPITLSIGKPLDPSKPHNWSYVHDNVNPSHTRTIDTNITVRPNPEV
jgi:hypothetical protein